MSLNHVQEVFFGGAAGGGKSDVLLMSALQYVHVPAYSAIIFRRTFSELALAGAIMARSHEWLAGTDARWSGDNKTWTFPSGATLTFGYLDAPQDHLRYQGSAFQFLGFDEITQFATDAQYRYLFSRLRRLAGSSVPLRVRSTGNPGGPGHTWVKDRFSIPEQVEFEQVYRPTKSRAFVPSRLEDCPATDRDEYEKSLSVLDSVTHAQLRHGRWIEDSSGLVYHFSREKNLIPALPPLDPKVDRDGWTYVFAADFGVTAATAFLVLAFRAHDPHCYVVESQKWQGLDSMMAGKKCRQEWMSRYEFERMIGDTGGLGKDYESVWRTQYRIPLHAASKSDKLGYIKLINGDLEHGLLKIVEGANQELIDELRGLSWKDHTHTKEHPGLPNHLTDALLYGWRSCRHWDFHAYEVPGLAANPHGTVQQKDLWERERIARVMDRADEEDDPDAWILGDA